MLEPVRTTSVDNVGEIEWYTKRLYFNGHDVTAGYRDLACVPKAFQSAAYLLGVDAPPPKLRKVANSQRGYTKKKGLNPREYGEAFKKEFPQFEVMNVYYNLGGSINLEFVQELMEVGNIDVGVFTVYRPVNHAMAIQRTASGFKIVDNSAFIKFVDNWKGNYIYSLVAIGLDDSGAQR